MLHLKKPFTPVLMTMLSTNVKKCKRKLNTLIMLMKILALKERKILMKNFVIYQFAY